MLGFIRAHFDRIRYFDSITGMSKILRRYFVMNAFDGALTIFGMLLGSFAVGVDNANLIVKIGLSTSVAIGFSGLTGALMTERAERTRELKSMERALHRRLDNTDYKSAYEMASIITACVDGLSPLLAAIVLLCPFLIMPIQGAYYLSFGLALGIFFLLGIFLGEVSREHVLRSGLYFLFAGLLCMAVILLLESISAGV
jgi:predicted membrane protein (TIGR00267 family)